MTNMSADHPPETTPAASREALIARFAQRIENYKNEEWEQDDSYAVDIMEDMLAALQPSAPAVPPEFDLPIMDEFHRIMTNHGIASRTEHELTTDLLSFLVRVVKKEVAQRTPQPSAPAEGKGSLTFDTLQAINKLRCEAAFHSVEVWAPWEWSNAMAGECGEACNVTKKMNRIWPANQFKQSWNKPEDQLMADLEQKLADELADVVIYADLLATRIGRSLGECIRHKFNEKSDEIGSAVKLPSAPSRPEEP